MNPGCSTVQPRPSMRLLLALFTIGLAGCATGSVIHRHTLPEKFYGSFTLDYAKFQNATVTEITHNMVDPQPKIVFTKASDSTFDFYVFADGEASFDLRDVSLDKTIQTIVEDVERKVSFSMEGDMLVMTIEGRDYSRFTVDGDVLVDNQEDAVYFKRDTD